MKYVLVFIFNRDLDKVLLIQKNKPEWQKGNLNGIGGKVENKESNIRAVIRETKEETKIGISPRRVIEFCIINNKEANYKVTCFAYRTYQDFTQMEEEIVDWYEVKDIITDIYPCISNIPWLVCMAKNILSQKGTNNEYLQLVKAEYGEIQ